MLFTKHDMDAEARTEHLWGRFACNRILPSLERGI